MFDTVPATAITTSRNVGSWYYAMTGATAIGAVWLALRRNRTRLAVVALAVGVALNLGWELALNVGWGRTYHAAGAPVVQLTYQALTEFGPPMVLLLLALEATGRPLGLELPTERQAGSTTTDRRFLAAYAGVVTVVGVLLVTGTGASGSVAVQRHVTWTFFAAEALLAALVLGACLLWRSRGTVAVFVLVGTLNVAVEVLGLATGLRIYAGLPPWLPAELLAVLIGYAEGGTAAALVWTAVRSQAFTPSSLSTPWHRTTDRPSIREDTPDP